MRDQTMQCQVGELIVRMQAQGWIRDDMHNVVHPVPGASYRLVSASYIMMQQVDVACTVSSSPLWTVTIASSRGV